MLAIPHVTACSGHHPCMRGTTHDGSVPAAPRLLACAVTAAVCTGSSPVKAAHVTTPPAPQPASSRKIGGCGYTIIGILAVFFVVPLTIGLVVMYRQSRSPAVSIPATTGGKTLLTVSKAFLKSDRNRVLGRSGNQYTTGTFTVGGSGDYDIYWSFRNNDGTGRGHFTFFGYNAGGHSDLNFNGPDLTGSADHGVTHVHHDVGRHYLTVSGFDAAWTIKIVAVK